ncbi:MAG TPA: histidine kinase [Chitinophagaceae bacterium]|nr:histidine kinase [Chitinophagaceae bacterium]
MFIPVVLKVFFTAILLMLVLPSFSRKRRIWMLVLQVVLLLAVFIAFELQYASSYRFSHLRHVGHLSSVFWINLIIYLVIVSVSFAVFFTKEWIAHEQQRRELVEYKLSSELNLLKSQINPHFLFNTLNNLFSLAQKHENNELASGIHKLSGLMRYLLYDSSADKVSVADEIVYIEDYIGLNKLRYDAWEVNVVFRVLGDPAKCYIAPMMLIPFVENAFKHGVKAEEHSTIAVVIACLPGTLHFSCTNPVFNNKMKEPHGGIGLDNVRRRLELLYPGRHKLDIVQDGSTYYVSLELYLV